MAMRRNEKNGEPLMAKWIAIFIGILLCALVPRALAAIPATCTCTCPCGYTLTTPIDPTQCPQCEPGSLLGVFCTYTQGGFTQTCSGNNVGCLLQTCMSTIGTMTIGSTTSTAYWDNSAAITAYLPAGGAFHILAPGALPNPGTTPGGSFAGQTLTLTISIAIDTVTITSPTSACHFNRASLPSCASSIKLADLIYTDASSPYNGLTVSAILAAANTMLRDGGTSAEVAALGTALNNINNNFDGCTHDNGFLSIPPPSP